MTDVAYPVVYSAFLAVAQSALSGSMRVTDGYDVSEDPSDVLMLGVPNLSDISSITSGNFRQRQVGHGAAGIVTEEGTVNGIVITWNGDASDAGALAARSAAFDRLADLNAAIRADRTLGVMDFDLVVGTAIASGDVAESKPNGAECGVSFTFNYTAQLG